MTLKMTSHNEAEGPETIPFPDPKTLRASDGQPIRPQPAPSSADEAAQAFESVSRQMKDLARELNCLGYFDDSDDNGDPPRAA